MCVCVCTHTSRSESPFFLNCPFFPSSLCFSLGFWVVAVATGSSSPYSAMLDINLTNDSSNTANGLLLPEDQWYLYAFPIPEGTELDRIALSNQGLEPIDIYVDDLAFHFPI